ncbi:2-dehydropantoate 2-reductase [Mycobacteroides immunogenum]|uniref:2-dehydropantoate 2-reductase n=1 Tax=Mycobacteroides immunogenum TaxID=83262 RepID=A0A179VC31_9MYCO|nr:2-dehydropantoate 2-reductase [Mycobacteroides immunogenum]OAT69294.1 2-dehydropantoate 2-reductase [Mycobacteroides immunogenum]
MLGTPRRFVIYGAGAVGGGLGALLTKAGHEVVLIARGTHLAALRSDGLQVVSQSGTETVPVAAVAGPHEVSLSAHDVVLLAMKSNDTALALNDLAVVAHPETTIVCVQNGVANERAALRRFAHVYGVPTVFPAVHLQPGVVEFRSWPIPAILDVGRYPSGVDDTAEFVAAAIESAGCGSVARPDIMRWKYAKLLTNLVNAIDAVATPGPTATDLMRRAQAEGVKVLTGAGIETASADEEQLRFGELRASTAQVRGAGIGGSSSWQSLARGTGRIESDYLNGEIALIARLNGISAPVNEFVRRLANGFVRDGRAPSSMSEAELRAAVDAGLTQQAC